MSSTRGLQWRTLLVPRAVYRLCVLLLGLLFSLAHAQNTTLKITPVTWDIIGLDSNDVTVGPNTFIVGARVCNIGSVAATNVTGTYLEQGTDNLLIGLRDQSSYTIASLPAGPDPDPTNAGTYFYPNPTFTGIPNNCIDFYFNVLVTRTSTAYTTTQGYIITASANNALPVSTPNNRQLYVERLVSQNRNDVLSLTGNTSVVVGRTYTYVLNVKTATNGYEQIEHFPNFPNNQFQILSISTSYTAPTGQKNNIAWGDACGWSNTIRDCVGPPKVSGGKMGGDITTTYVVRIIGPGNGRINNLIYDFSGSSFHYNSDYDSGTQGAALDFQSFLPADLTVTKSTSTPTVIRPLSGSNTATYTIEVSNSGVANTGTATSVVINDPLPSNFTLNSTTSVTLTGGATRPSGTNPAANTTNPSWGNFSIPAGGKVTIVYNVNVPSTSALGTFDNSATATYTEADGTTTGLTRTYNGTSSTQENVTVVSPYDFGDAPSTYGTVSHLVGGGFMGAGVDTEGADQPNATATGDDLAGTDDEDGVTLNPSLGSNYSTVALAGSSNSMQVVASAAGFVNAWMDLNLDGDFLDSGEQILTNQTVTTGTNNLTFALANNVRHGPSFVRVRYTTSSVSTPSPTGVLSSGEVEDHRINIAVPMPSGQCGVGLTNGGFESLSVPLSTYIITNKTNVPGWNTTASDNQIEIWQSGYLGVPAFEGTKFAELNANVVAALYQDIVTVPGQVIRYTFAHRGRDGSDTMALRIGAPNNTISGIPQVGSYTDGNTSWGFYTGSYTVPAGQFVTRFAFESVSAAGGNQSIGNFLDSVSFAAPCVFQGKVYEDFNYGGGNGRNFNAAQGMSGVPATIELYNANGQYLFNTTANASGDYQLNIPLLGTHHIRVVNGSVQSSRTGYASGLLPVQTYRSGFASGAVTAINNEVGGRAPASSDAAASVAGATLNTSNFTLSSGGQAQTVSQVDVTQTSVNVTGVNFGFNFSTIVNTNNSGQGSLRQFVTNANALGGEASLAQSGNRLTITDTTESLPAGKETSIFMIPDAQLTGTVNNRVGIITLNSTLQFTGTNAQNTILDGTTQSVNIANSNAGTLGTGGRVGTGVDALESTTADNPVLNTVPKPEIEIKAPTSSIPGMGLRVQVNNITVRGVSLYGFGATPDTNDNANIQIDNNLTGTLIEQSFLGIAANRAAFNCPTGGATGQGDNIRSVGADSGTVQNNLIGCSNGKGVDLNNASTLWQILGNEIRGNAVGNWQMDGIDLINSGSGNATVTGNLVAANGGVGVDSFSGLGGNTIQNNTIEGNGIATSGSNPKEDAGVRIFGSGSTLRYNVIRNNTGSGVQVQAQWDYSGSLQPDAVNNTISQNAIYGNTKIGIDLLNRTDTPSSGTSPFVTVNDSGDGDVGGNNLLNFPVFSTAVLIGSNLEVTGFARPGALIELFLSDNDSSGFGEGQIYLGSVTEGCSTVNTTTCFATDADSGTGSYAPNVNGLNQGSDNTNRFSFLIPLSSLKSTVSVGSKLTATATLSTNTSEFSGQVTVGLRIAGTVFEDVNFGGTARDYSAANLSAVGSGWTSGQIRRPNARVELYNNAGAYQTFTTTDANGQYRFDVTATGTYQVRVVNSSVTSVRTSSGGTLLPVQTFRTNGVTSVTNEIGGRNPAEVDAGNNSGSQSIATLDALTGQHVQSLTSVTVSTAGVSGVDFGFNFDTIVNTNDNGQGSVAQFITNANALGDESKLAQSGNRKDLSNTNQSLPSGKETSIFVIPDAQLTGALNSRVAVINLSGASDPALPAFNGTNAQHTILDGSTQTVNVANSNQGVLGAGGTVGTGPDGVQGTADDPALSQIQRPEVQIIGRIGINGLSVTASNITIRGIAIRGFGQNTTGSDHGDIYVAGASNLTIEQNIIGSNPTAFSDPGSGNRSSNGIVFWSGTINTVVIQNNLIGFTTNRGIAATGAVLTLDGLTVQQNEIRSTNQSGSFQGGGLELNPSYSPAGTIQRNITIQQNLITGVGTGDSAIEIGYAPSDTNKVIQDNTLSNNAFAGVAMSLDPQSGTATHNTNTGRDYIRRNVITGNGVGIQIYANGTITSLENKTISQNAIYDNSGLGINLGVDAVTGNNGQKTAAQPNQMIDYPIITSSTLTGNSLQIRGVVGSNLPSTAVPSPNNSTFAGATVEFFIADNSPANQDGEVLLGDGRTKPHGEGSIYIGQGTADANGNFNVTLTLTPAQVTALGTATNVTATATDASGNTSEFGAVLLVNTVSGRIFDDVNYGGGAGRNYTTANTSAQNGGTGFANNAIGRSGATIEVYDATVAGNPVDLDPVTAGVQNSITSGTDGVYSIQLVEGNYRIRVVNNTVSSVRTATGGTPLAVQTFRTDASTGTAVAVTNEVGGRNLAEVDAGTNATSTLATLNGVAGQEVQSLSSVNLTAANVTGVDFGFNFDTIVNTNNAGQGSLRQFVLNSNILNNTNLNQVGQVAGKEASIFMIPETALTNDVAVINLTSSVTVTDSNTTLTGLTQTTNIADKNTGALGTGDNVGVDGLALSKVNAPEVEIILASGTTLQVNGTQFTLQGVALRGGNQLILGTSTLPATGFLIDQNIFGTTAKAFVVPTSGSLSQQFGMQIFNGSGTVQNNLIGFSATSGIDYIGGPAGVTIQNNEFQQNGRTISGGDAITLSGSLNAKAVTITGNLIANSNSSGIQFEIGSVANNVVTNNSITRNGYGGAASRLEGAGIHYLARTNAVNSTNTDLISKNLIFDNQKSGIVINYGQRNVRISQNSFYANGLTSIDFTTSDGFVGGNGNYGQGDGVTPNDGTTIARQGNTGIDYPVFNTATLAGNTVNFSGFVGNGLSTTFDGQTAILELYKAADDGNQNGPVIVGDGKNVPHGEGRTYLGSVTVTLGTNGAFSGSLTVPAGTLTSSDFLVATTTIGNNTSEFSPLVALAGFSISGSVYADLQPNSVKDGTEDWTSGTTVYVHLIQSGNVVATTPVAAGTGAFSFSSVTNGTYTLAVSRNAGTVGSPAPVIAAPLEWLYITPQNGTLQVDVLNSNVTGQNFGLFRGSLVRGRVFYDDAFGASSAADESKANNALQDLSEKGASGVTVTAVAGSNTVTAVTDASGDFRMYLPHAQFGGQSVVLSHQVQPATGTNLNNTSSIQLATTLNDGLAASRTFTSTSGQILGTYHFGILRSAVWRPDQSGTTSSPGIIEYLHSYQPQTLGEVAFSTNGNLYYGVYGDLNCDGTISASERNINLLATPMQVGYDWPRLTDGSFKPCEVVVQVNVPSNVAPNSVDRVRVKAELSWENNTSVKNPLFLIDTTTTRGLASGGKLSLTKGLRNVTQGETNFTTNNGGKVNEVIEYKITFSNSGNTVITDVVLGDNVPFFTDVVQNAYGTGELQLYCPNGSVVNVELGNISVIDLPLNLPTTCNISQMAPGEQGYFLYRVRIR